MLNDIEYLALAFVQTHKNIFSCYRIKSYIQLKSLSVSHIIWLREPTEEEYNQIKNQVVIDVPEYTIIPQ